MSSEAGNLHEIQPSNEFNIKKLLSQATSKGRVNQEYEIYNQSRHRKLYSFVRESITVGCIGIEILSKNECEIKHIAVLPDEHGSGIGSQMIQLVCAKHLLRKISAETDRDAVDFYRKYGFKIIKLGEKYPGVERYKCEYKTKEAGDNNAGATSN